VVQPANEISNNDNNIGAALNLDLEFALITKTRLASILEIKNEEK
jgi:hypothetical protein